jgi:hypothetical protein
MNVKDDEKGVLFSSANSSYGYDVSQVFEQDRDLLSLQRHISYVFRDTFARGLREYLTGNWTKAGELLKESDRIMRRNLASLASVRAKTLQGKEEKEGLGQGRGRGQDFQERIKEDFDLDLDSDNDCDLDLLVGDGPSQTLLAYLKGREFQAPQDWAGCRALTSK